MSIFLQHIAQHIASKYDDASQLTVILPSQRAQKYLQDELYECYQRPFFSPKFITIDKWVKEVSSKRIVSKTALLFELYHLHCKNNVEQESFEEFANWGELLLNDFDEIDRYLVNAEQIFGNLCDIKEIENWSFNSTELTENQKKFLEFWEKMGSYYTSFNVHLKSKEVTYNGAAYREISENLRLIFQSNEKQSFLFAGFNALSPAEISIIKQLVKMGKAECFIEGDDFFVKDTIHEAGVFIRQLKQQIPEVKLVSSNKMLEDEKEINFINCSEHTSQAKVGLTLLSEFSEEEIKDTLLLLTDETLIVPAIKNLPSTIKEANITLGLPLKYTHLKTWINLVFSIQEHAVYFESKNAAYHKDLIALLNNSLFQKITNKEERLFFQEWQRQIIQYNRIFSSIDKNDQLSEITQTFLQRLFKPWNNNWLEALDTIIYLNEFLFSKLDVEHDLLERSAMYQFDKSIKEFASLMKENAPKMSMLSFKSIFNRHWTNKSVAYYGNPTTGLQIMGLLETRMLSFKNIIVLGLNEGSMPPTNSIQTIIPMDLRKYYGMPTPGEKEALFAHHFYRLLPEATKIWISYFSGESNFGSEPSRYIKQIELEWVKQNPKIKLNKMNFQIPLNSDELIENSIEQTESSQNVLKEMFKKGLSASAMNKFLTCPLDFYYRYIFGLREEDAVEEDVESSTFGSFVHKTLENLYEKFVGKQVTEFDIDEMIRIYPIELEKVFLEHFNQLKEAFNTGKNQLSYQMASYQIERYLKFERKMLQENPTKKLIIHALESKLSYETNLEFMGEMIPVKILGLIDRIDQFGEEIRIIDYKTGKCESKNVFFKITEDDLEDIEQIKKQLKDAKYALQLGVYALLFKENKGYNANSNSIMSFRNIESGFQALTIKEGSVPEETFTSFIEKVVVRIAHEMINTTYFKHDEDSQYCDYCA